MTSEACGRETRSVLSGAGWSVHDASKHISSLPGLYSIHAAAEVWANLGLEHRAGIPLYVGKPESSLADRELGQHFAIDPGVMARTGSSTVRRSFAALLREPLGLRGVPRIKEKPERFANFGLEPEGDHLLTRWMHNHLTLAVWPMPVHMNVSKLETIEEHVIRLWMPPLNIKHNPGRPRHLHLAHAQLAVEAKAWALAETTIV